MRLFRVKRSNALLQCQQTLVDLGTFKTSLSVVTLGISSAFRSSQINEKPFSAQLALLISYLDLANSV